MSGEEKQEKGILDKIKDTYGLEGLKGAAEGAGKMVEDARQAILDIEARKQKDAAKKILAEKTDEEMKKQQPKTDTTGTIQQGIGIVGGRSAVIDAAVNGK